jgi:uncharacterized small protein (DUF1192 family)
MANERSGKISSIFNKTVATVSVKTSVMLDSAKIKTQIGTLQNEIKGLQVEIGVKVYELWAEDRFDVSLIEDKCVLIREKTQTVESLLAEIERLKNQESEVFGKKGEDAGNDDSPASKLNVICQCSNCKTQYSAPAKFCKKCGSKMTER